MSYEKTQLIEEGSWISTHKYMYLGNRQCRCVTVGRGAAGGQQGGQGGGRGGAAGAAGGGRYIEL